MWADHWAFSGRSTCETHLESENCPLSILKHGGSSSVPEAFVLVAFVSVIVIKHLAEGRKRVGSQSKIQSLMAGKPRQLEESEVTEPRDECRCSPPRFLCLQSVPTAHGMVLPASRGDPPSSVKPFWEHPNGDTPCGDFKPDQVDSVAGPSHHSPGLWDFFLASWTLRSSWV